MENFFIWRVTYICVHVTQAQILPTSSKHVSVGMRFLGLGIGGLSHQSCMSLHIGTNNIVGGSIKKKIVLSTDLHLFVCQSARTWYEKNYHVHCITSISPWYTPINGIIIYITTTITIVINIIVNNTVTASVATTATVCTTAPYSPSNKDTFR